MEAVRLANKVKGKDKTEEGLSTLTFAADDKHNKINHVVDKKESYDSGDIFILKEPIKFRDEIQELMKQNTGIIREETKLQNGLKRILDLKNEFYSRRNTINKFKIDDVTDNSDIENLVLTWQVKSSLITCEAIIRSALIRQESRGAHYRSDFPKLDDEKWKVNIYCRNSGEGGPVGEMALFKQSVKEIKGPLADYLKEHIKAEHQREFE